MRLSASCAAGTLRLSAMPRLLRFIAMNAADSPFTLGRSIKRVSSPPGMRSTLTTSAPRSASSMPQVGPAMICASSRTLRPASGPAILATPELRLALGEESRHAFAKVLGVETSVAFEVFLLRKRLRVCQAADELLVPARGERRALGDAPRGGVGLLDHLVVGHDAV